MMKQVHSKEYYLLKFSNQVLEENHLRLQQMLRLNEFHHFLIERMLDFLESIHNSVDLVSSLL